MSILHRLNEQLYKLYCFLYLPFKKRKFIKCLGAIEELIEKELPNFSKRRTSSESLEQQHAPTGMATRAESRVSVQTHPKKHVFPGRYLTSYFGASLKNVPH